MIKGYLIISGGVCSSLGKGVAAASIGALLESHGLTVFQIKIDPYLNVDAGSMNPYQHGEVYVTADGAETDLDLGNYARFTHSPIGRQNSITAGQVYQQVIDEERAGKYLGQTVQVIPHITDRIKYCLTQFDGHDNIDVVIIEIGGTVGDIESIPFIEAARQLIYEADRAPVLSIHTTLVPHISNGELKTKPTQHSVKELREIGIQPHILICRSSKLLEASLREKIALFTNVDKQGVISAPDVQDTIYEVPGILKQQNIDRIILDRLRCEYTASGNSWWDRCVAAYSSADHTVTIAMVGKYLKHADSYHSVEEALLHAAVANNTKLHIERIDADTLSEHIDEAKQLLASIDGIIVPGGFGKRGVRGIIMAIRCARESNIPFLGICIGMQLMAIECARNILGHADADSAEFNPHSRHIVVDLMAEQKDEKRSGGTMRLGVEHAILTSARMQSIYGKEAIAERHRHRYEIVPDWIDRFRQSGLDVGAVHAERKLVEALHWRDHRWGIGVQYHPEFTSRPTRANPLFRDFIAASLGVDNADNNGQSVPRYSS